VLLVYLLTNHDQIAATVVLMNHKPFQGGRAPLASTFREFPKRGSSPHVHDHDSRSRPFSDHESRLPARSRRWGEYWLELLGDSGFVPEDRLAMPELYENYMIVGVAIETPKLKGWRLKGIIYSKSGKELKQLELKQATFSDKITAQSDALRMCRYWIDIYGSELGQLLKLA
jgi:hypothetical protein